jgi:mono/diheme cytochrome c family protein
VTRRCAALLGAALSGAALLAACGGGDRDFGRADTAALLSDSLAALVAESARAAGDSALADAATTDSIRAAFGGDSLGVDAAGAVARVVLRADSAAGDVLYHGRGGCLTCHALNGAGVAGIAPSLRDSVWLHGDGDPAMIERVVREGVAQPKSVSNRMPGFAATLSDAEIRRIAAYVFAISHFGGTVVDTAGAPADSLDRAGDAEP